MHNRTRRVARTSKLLVFSIVTVVAVLSLTPFARRSLVPSSPPMPPPPAPAPAPPPPVEFGMFRGNPERNLSAIGTVPRRPKLLWRFTTQTKLEGAFEQRGAKKFTAAFPWRGLGWTGQPVRLGDDVYFGAADSYVYCLNAETGEVRWHYPTGHSVKGSISLSNERLYHGGRDNRLHCYDLDGRMVWETRTGNDIDSNPVVVDDRIYVGGEDNSIYCFDAATGKPVWRTPTAGSVESSPCVAEGRVYAGSSRGMLYCCNAEDGKILWKFNTGGDTDSTPVFYEGKIFVGCATGDVGEKGHLYCLDAASGEQLWHVLFRRGIWATVALNPVLGRLYVGINNGTFYALNMADGTTVWTRDLGNRIWGSAAVTDGCILVPVRDGRLWCLEEKTGEPLWVFDDGFDIDATPMVAGGIIVIGSQNGWVYGIGVAGEDEEVNSHWFATTFPIKKFPDHDPEGIITVENPAKPPATCKDTSARSRQNYLKPVYGPGAAQKL
ncbi:MAG: beta-alanine-activating enzyme beta-propeller domain-containing protein [Armatimonadota bacterium]